MTILQAILLGLVVSSGMVPAVIPAMITAMITTSGLATTATATPAPTATAASALAILAALSVRACLRRIVGVALLRILRGGALVLGLLRIDRIGHARLVLVDVGEILETAREDHRRRIGGRGLPAAATTAAESAKTTASVASRRRGREAGEIIG